MDRILSGYLYLFLGIGSVVAIFALRGLQGSVGLLRRYGWLVGYYLMLAGTIALQNRNEWTEASRLKIFIEIPVWIAAAYLVHLIGVRLQQRKTRRRSPETRAQ
jgi:biotin transporter BioY